jgi:glycine dehydrogenase
MSQLQNPASFASRHIGPRADALAKMLATIGSDSVESLLDAAIPTSIRLTQPLDLPLGVSEVEALSRLADIARENTVLKSMIGQGYYGTHTPEVIRRNVVENPAWYTAYTPYQPEISQGRLELLLRFQTMVCELTDMDISGASLLDDATAAAEAMALALRVSKTKSNRFVIDANLHPQVIDVVRTRAIPLGIDLVVGQPTAESIGGAFGVLLAHVASTGYISTHHDVVAAAKEHGVFVCVHTDLLACTLVDGPGVWGADAVVGSAQRFGVPMFAGGPHAGFLALKTAHQRSLPGRLVGVSIDRAGRRAYRLALQTREQHIRREKATSNICTAQVLLAVCSALYACWHGNDGLVEIAERVHGHATTIVNGLAGLSPNVVVNETWFDTVTVDLEFPPRADLVMAAALASGINL